jgi:hypothetical protein
LNSTTPFLEETLFEEDIVVLGTLQNANALSPYRRKKTRK